MKIECLVTNTPELHLNTDFSCFLSRIVLLRLCSFSSFNEGLALIEFFLMIPYRVHREFENISV